MHTVLNETSGKNVRTERKIDPKEKEQIMEKIYQSPVYHEFLKQWGGILTIRNIEL